MNKAELISAVAEKAGLTKAQAKEALDALVTTITEAARTEDTVTLSGLGTFKGKTRPARTVRNPATGGAVEVAEKRVLNFKASTGLQL